MIPKPDPNKLSFKPLLNGFQFIVEFIFCVIVILAFCYSAVLGYYYVACASILDVAAWSLVVLVFFPIAFPLAGVFLVAMSIAIAAFRPFNQFKHNLRYLFYAFLVALLTGLVSSCLSSALDAHAICRIGF
jgi:hypothetical protein